MKKIILACAIVASAALPTAHAETENCRLAATRLVIELEKQARERGNQTVMSKIAADRDGAIADFEKGMDETSCGLILFMPDGTIAAQVASMLDEAN